MKIKKAENIEAEKNKIIEAGFRCFIKKGYARTSVNDIVKEYGKSKGNLYYYFTNKEDIFCRLVQQNANLLNDTLERLTPIEIDFCANVQDFCD